jgi:hypothetical protein
VGLGTWVESKVDLSRFRGQRIRLRFLTSDLKITGAQAWTNVFASFVGQPGDDGWWIDGIEVTNTLTSPVTLSVDSSGFTGTACGAICNTITPVITTDPSPPDLTAPGQPLEIDASGSTADRCIDGTLQFRFCVDGNGSLTCDDLGGADTLLRSWTDNPVIVVVPDFPGDVFIVEIRCSSDPDCGTALGPGPAKGVVQAKVECPGIPAPIRFGNPSTPGVKNRIYWDTGPAIDIDWTYGSFTTSTSISTFAETACTDLNAVGSIDITSLLDPAAGSGFWFLVKKDGPVAGLTVLCNDNVTWQNLPRNEAARDANLASNCP